MIKKDVKAFLLLPLSLLKLLFIVVGSSVESVIETLDTFNQIIVLEVTLKMDAFHGSMYRVKYQYG